MDVAVAYTSVASARCRPTLIGQCEKPRAVGRQQIQTSTLFCISTSGQDVVRAKNTRVTLWHYSNTSTLKNRHKARPRRCSIPHPNPTTRLSSPAILFTQSSDRHSCSSYCSSPPSLPSPTTAKLTEFTMISTMTTKQQVLHICISITHTQTTRMHM